MYESYFGLRCEPFSVAPDPRFLYLSEKHREALGYLMYGLRRAGGFVLLTGEIGAGKTTVWRAFLEQLPGQMEVAYVANPKLNVQALLRRICEELRIELAPGQDDLIDALHGHLLLAHASGRRTLIAVDEAQALSFDVLEQLRLLTNLVTNESKLVQVLLIGQPELRNMLAMPEMESVSQRVVARFHLPALSLDEVRHYLAHRLEVAGYQGPGLFDDEAVRRIHRLCRGTPRRINVLCDRALLLAQQAGDKRVDRALVDLAAAAVFGRALPGTVPISRLPWARWIASGAGLGAVLVAASWGLPQLGMFRSPAGGPPSAPLSTPPPAPLSDPTGAAAGPAGAAVAPALSASSQVLMQVGASALAELHPSAPAAATAGGADPLEAWLAAGDGGQAQAWRRLAELWGTPLGSAGEPCAAAREQGLVCYSVRRGLGPIRQLERPGILSLSDERGRSAHVLLTGLDENTVTLQALQPGAIEQRVALARLAWVWHGDFATYWRAPPGANGRNGDGPAVTLEGAQGDWLARQLAVTDGGPPHASDSEMLRTRVKAFQLTQGLRPDGQVGPMTLMLLNRASGVPEPRLPYRHAQATPPATKPAGLR